MGEAAEGRAGAGEAGVAGGPLTEEERERAGRTAVYVVWYCYETADHWGLETDGSFPVALCASAEEAKAEAARCPIPPVAGAPTEEGRVVTWGPWNLLAVVQRRVADADAARRAMAGEAVVELAAAPDFEYAFARVGFGVPGSLDQELRSPPLTAEEHARAEDTEVWAIWYEDRFHVGANRESYPVALCLSEAEAQEAYRQRIEAGERPIGEGFDGIEVKGPFRLGRICAGRGSTGPDAVREVLRRLDAGEAGPVWLPV